MAHVTMTPTNDDLGADVARLGDARSALADEAVTEFIRAQLAVRDFDGRSVCVIVPDATRTCPLPLLMRAIHGALHGRVSQFTVLVALGTHAPMGEAALDRHLGGELQGWRAAHPGIAVLNHAWHDPATFVDLGVIGADRVHELSDGRLDLEVRVRINRAVVEHDVALVVGPVFPHEVVGFSGGNKYLFPGVSGQEMIDASHWLGALITSRDLIGTLGTTPVRALIDDAAAMLPCERLALCVVTRPGSGLHASTFGTPEAAWSAAATVAYESHVRFLDAPFQRVLSLVPERYDDLWTGAKGFYKVEPIVADGGQVVLHAPHITEISTMHPAIARIGYHCRDYFLGQRDRFADEAWGDLAHSTHLRGAGTWDPVLGESCRVTVTLATGIPEAEVRAVGLDYLDPHMIDVAAWEADPEALVVHDAGEALYRLRTGTTSLPLP